MITSELSQHSYQRSARRFLIPNENVQKSQEKDPSARSSSAKRRKETCQTETEAWSGRNTRGSQAQEQITRGYSKGRYEREKKTQPHAGTARATGGSDESQMGCEESCRRREHTAKFGACAGRCLSAAVKAARATHLRRDGKGEGDLAPAAVALWKAHEIIDS
jgi:hypothetical protein